MTRAELEELHAAMTKLRGTAHRAYETALRNRRDDGDTRDAYDALLLANRIRNRVYAAIIKSVADG